MPVPNLSPVRGFPGYFVSRDGNVSGKRGWSLKARPRSTSRPGNIPYLSVALYGPQGRKDRFVHHLVLEAFVGPRPEGCEARHLNGDHSDNRVENLAWGTKAENGADKVLHRPNCKNCNRPMEGRNLMMVSNGVRKVRKCRACHYERGRIARQNRKEVAGR